MCDMSTGLTQSQSTTPTKLACFCRLVSRKIDKKYEPTLWASYFATVWDMYACRIWFSVYATRRFQFSYRPSHYCSFTAHFLWAKYVSSALFQLLKWSIRRAAKVPTIAEMNSARRVHMETCAIRWKHSNYREERVMQSWHLISVWLFLRKYGPIKMCGTKIALTLRYGELYETIKAHEASLDQWNMIARKIMNGGRFLWVGGRFLGDSVPLSGQMADFRVELNS